MQLVKTHQANRESNDREGKHYLVGQAMMCSPSEYTSGEDKEHADTDFLPEYRRPQLGWMSLYCRLQLQNKSRGKRRSEHTSGEQKQGGISHRSKEGEMSIGWWRKPIYMSS
jgi:hypothetical protein